MSYPSNPIRSHDAKSHEDIPVTERKRVACYSRVSSLDQVKNYSLGIQERRLREYCATNGFLRRMYREEGKSGFSSDRPAYQQMIEDAYQGCFETIIIDKLDRLGRNTVDMAEFYSLMDSMGINIISLTEGIDTSNVMGKLFLFVLSIFAEMERERLMERSKAGKEARQQEGKWHGGPPPFGYDYDSESGLLYINEEESEVVQHIFHKYLEYESLSQVANYLTDEEIPSRNGGKWAQTTIRGILSRETYIGKQKQGEYEHFYEDLIIVDGVVFEEAQRILQERKKYSPKAKHQRTYTNEFFCYHCGRRVNEYMRFCSHCGGGLEFIDIADNRGTSSMPMDSGMH